MNMLVKIDKVAPANFPSLFVLHASVSVFVVFGHVHFVVFFRRV